MHLKHLIFTISLILSLIYQGALSEEKLVEFPYEIQSSGIVIEKQAYYEGLFFENGEEELVGNVAALLIRNGTGKMVEALDLTLQTDDEVYDFSCTFLPPGGRVLVPEKGKKRWNDEKIRRVSSLFTFREDEEKDFSASQKGKCELVVENNSGEDCPVLHIFYKSYYPDDELLLGGYSFQACVYNIRAGETKTVPLQHFAAGYSKIVAINRADTD